MGGGIGSSSSASSANLGEWIWNGPTSGILPLRMLRSRYLLTRRSMLLMDGSSLLLLLLLLLGIGCVVVGTIGLVSYGHSMSRC